MEEQSRVWWLAGMLPALLVDVFTVRLRRDGGSFFVGTFNGNTGDGVTFVAEKNPLRDRVDVFECGSRAMADHHFNRAVRALVKKGYVLMDGPVIMVVNPAVPCGADTDEQVFRVFDEAFDLLGRTERKVVIL